MSDETLKRLLLRAAAAVFFAAALYAALRYLLPWLLPFLLAAAISYAMEPAVAFLQKRLSLRRGFASLVLTLFALFLLGGVLSLLGTTLLREAASLLDQAPALLAAIPASLRALLAHLEQAAGSWPDWLRETLSQSLERYAAEAGDLIRALLSRYLTALGALAAALPQFFLACAVCVLAIYYTSSAWPWLRNLCRTRLPEPYRQPLRMLRSGVLRSLSRWLRAELTLCTVTFAQLLAVFLFMKEPYALLLAFLITLLDALPVFGTGTVLVPWAVCELLFRHIPQALILTALFLLTLSVHSVLEPRLMGAQAGLPPIASLLAMYLGFCVFGVAGMILFPFLLLLWTQLRRETAGAALSGPLR